MTARRVALAVLLTLAAFAAARALEVPFLSGRIVDQAGLLSSEDKQRIEQKLSALEAKTGAQVAVLTVTSLEGDSLEDFSMRVASTWKLGQQGKDNGLLFLIAKDDRKMRMEVGYGLEEFLTDLKTGRIQDELVRPKFRQGDYPGGIEAGIDAIVGTIEGQDVLPAAAPAPANQSDIPARLVAFLIYAVVVTPFCLMAMFSRGGQSWFLYLFLMPFHLLFPMALYPALGPALLGVWGIGFPIWKILTRNSKFAEKKWFGGGGGFGGGFGGGSWTSGGGWSSGGGGFSGGGFSGGGGSFGGGGSSSSW